jgi:hypothetical protein
MIVHVLRFGFKSGTSANDKAKVKAALTRLAAVDPVKFSSIGQDLGDPAEGYEMAYCVAFNELADLKQYMLHEPAHRDADFAILPHLSKIAAVDMSDNPDPTLRDQIGALHQYRVTNDPEFAALLSSIAGQFATAK